jgi:hypothetical protein
MVRHDDERVQEEFPLAVIVKDGLLKLFGRGRDLKKVAAIGHHSGNQIRPGFLGREPHSSRINERPVAKATIILRGCIQEPEGSCSLRNQSQRSPPSTTLWGHFRLPVNC